MAEIQRVLTEARQKQDRSMMETRQKHDGYTMNITHPEGKKLGIAVLTLVTVLAACIFFTHLGDFPLFNPDEALYAEPAREMNEIHEYITTYLNYVVRFTKPPLVIWAMALCYQIFGVGEFAARFFGASCGVVLVSVTYLFAARYFSTLTAFVAAMSLLCAPLYLGTAREAITDMPLSLFMAGAQMAFFHAFASKDRRYSYLGYLLVALSVMTKGPVGLVLPVGILATYHLLRGDLLEALKFHRVWLGALIIAIVALPWFVVEIAVTKGAYFQEFIMRENVQRFTDNVDSHKQPFWYHAAAMFGGYLPFTVFLPQSYFREFKQFFSLIRSKPWGEGFRALSNRDSLGLYCLIWSTAVLVFFSLSVSKLLPYTLPAFPALAILLASELYRNLESKSFVRLALPLLLLLVVFAGVGYLAPHLLAKARDVPAEAKALLTAACAYGAFVSMVSIMLLRFGKRTLALVLFPSLMAVGVFYGGLMALPLMSKSMEGDLPAFSRFAGQGKLPIIVFDMRKPGVPFYALRKVENINGYEPLKQRLAQLGEASILCRSQRVDILVKDGAKLISQKGAYALLEYRKAAE